MRESRLSDDRMHRARKHAKIEDFYEYVSTLGEGNFGSVTMWKLRQNADGPKSDHYVAVKHIKWSAIESSGCCGFLTRKHDSEQEAAVSQELGYLRDLDHSYIVRFREWFEHDRRGFFFVMELCRGPSLQVLLDRTCMAPETERHEEWKQKLRRCFYQTVYAVSYVHNKRIVHRDLKPDNIMLQSENVNARIKLIDWGLAALREHEFPLDRDWTVGTMEFMPPSRFTSGDDRKIRTSCDMWALGVIFAYIVTSVQHGQQSHPILMRGETITRASLTTVYSCHAPWNRELFLGQDASAFDLADKVFEYPHKKRIDAKAMLNSDWVLKCQLSPSMVDAKHSRSWDAVFENLRTFHELTPIEKMIIKRVARYVSDSQVTELRRIFEALDREGKGVLTVAEMQDGLKNFDIDLPQDVIDNMVKGLCPNKMQMNHIEDSTWLAATLGERILQDEHALMNAFWSLDVSHSGCLVHSDFVVVVGESRVDELVSECSKDADLMSMSGKDDKHWSISFQQFRNIVRRIAKKRRVIKSRHSKLQELDQILLAPVWKTIETLLVEKKENIPRVWDTCKEESKIMELRQIFLPASEVSPEQDTRKQIKYPLQITRGQLDKCIQLRFDLQEFHDIALTLFDAVVDQSPQEADTEGEESIVDFTDWLFKQICESVNEDSCEQIFKALTDGFGDHRSLTWDELKDIIGAEKAEAIKADPITEKVFMNLKIGNEIARSRAQVLLRTDT